MTPPINLGILASSKDEAFRYWISSRSATEIEPTALKISSDGNIYVTGVIDQSSPRLGIVSRYDGGGILKTEKQVYNFYNATLYDISPVGNSNDNFYAVGSAFASTSAGSLIEFDSSGRVVNSIAYYVPNVKRSDPITHVLVRSDQRLITFSSCEVDTGNFNEKNDLVVGIAPEQIDSYSSWTFQGFTNDFSEFTWNSVDLDSNDNIYGSFSAGTADYGVVKINGSTLSKEWDLNISAGNFSRIHVSVDKSTDDLYVVHESTDRNAARVITRKFDSSGNAIWAREWQKVTNQRVLSVATDSSSNVYILAQAGDLSIIKYDSSGSMVWQRKLTFTSGSRAADPQIKINQLGDMIILANYELPSASGISEIILSLPADGSLTGTYSLGSDTIVYGSQSGSSTSYPLRDNSKDLSSVSISASFGSVNYTEQNISTTKEYTPIQQEA